MDLAKIAATIVDTVKIKEEVKMDLPEDRGEMKAAFFFLQDYICKLKDLPPKEVEPATLLFSVLDQGSAEIPLLLQEIVASNDVPAQIIEVAMNLDVSRIKADVTVGGLASMLVRAKMALTTITTAPPVGNHAPAVDQSAADQNGHPTR